MMDDDNDDDWIMLMKGRDGEMICGTTDDVMSWYYNVLLTYFDSTQRYHHQHHQLSFRNPV